MTGVVLSIPEDTDALPTWLERQLVGPTLPRLVAELRVIHRPSSQHANLDSVLGSAKADVSASGLAVLPREALSKILRQPDLLLELQDFVFQHGGPYWDGVAAEDDFALRADAVTGRVLRSMAADPIEPRRGIRPWLTHALTAIAASVVVFAAIHFSRTDTAVPPTSDVRWFAKVGELPPTATDAKVFTTLADIAAAWPEKPPENAEAFARRLLEFRNGCAVLQMSQSIPLTEGNRQWLRLRCADWAAEIDQHLRHLENTRDVATTAVAANQTMHRIVIELRERAAQKSSS